jgi:hypothetical protein
MFGFGRRTVAPAPVAPPARPTVAETRAALRSVAAEALIRQDEAEAVIRSIRAREQLGLVARRGGPLVRRFFALRDELPSVCDDPEDARIRDALDAILHAHALAVSVALDLLACEWRSDRLARQVDSLTGLGAPAEILEVLYRELGREDRASASASEPGAWSDPEQLVV